MRALIGFCVLGSAATAHASGRLATTPIWTVDGTPYSPEIAGLGLSVGSAGDLDGDGFDDLIVGAPQSFLGCCQQGAVFIYRGSVAGPTVEFSAGVLGASTSGYGTAVDSAGDVNGDGLDDVIFAGSYEGSPNRAVVYHGVAAAWPISSAPAWSFTYATGGTFWPSAVAGAGDVNGDGYDDVIVGNRSFTQDGLTRCGRALVFLGSPTGLSTAAAWTVTGTRAQENLGFTVASAGDVNDDDFGDVLVGNSFQARLYLGSASGLALTPAWTAQMRPILGDYYSYGEVASAGDVDADGYVDVIVGSPGFANGSDEGRVALYRGSAAGLSATPLWTVESNRPGARFGCSVAGAGDVDADGYGDLIVGDGSFRGRASLFLGSPSGPSQAPAWFIDGATSGSQFGLSVRGAGDVNADGRDDVIVGSPGGSSGSGEAFLYLGVPAESSGPAPPAPDGSGAEEPLVIARGSADSLTLSWGVSCLANEMDWEIYEGMLGAFTSHVPSLCSTGGQHGARLVPMSGDRYFIIVPRTLDFEGAYGRDTSGQRPPSTSACLPQSVTACP